MIDWRRLAIGALIAAVSVTIVLVINTVALMRLEGNGYNASKKANHHTKTQAAKSTTNTAGANDLQGTNRRNWDDRAY